MKWTVKHAANEYTQREANRLHRRNQRRQRHKMIAEHTEQTDRTYSRFDL